MEISKMLNINNINVEEKIKESISNVKSVLNGLDTERTCQIYSSYLFNELQKNHILSFLINTKDIGLDYEHYFIIAKDGVSNFVIDLTYDQFGYTDPESLLNDGYMKVTEEELRYYLRKLSKLRNNHKQKG